jgi:hypothetical protein
MTEMDDSEVGYFSRIDRELYTAAGWQPTQFVRGGNRNYRWAN